MMRHLGKAVMLGGIAMLAMLAIVGPRRAPLEQPESPGPEPARITIAPPPRPTRTPPTPPRPPEPPEAPAEAPDLLAQTAGEWRARMRGDSPARGRLAELLSDPALTAEIAEVVALVLGSLGERAALLKILEQGSAAPREALIYAAGLDSSGPEGEIFRRPEGPRVVTTPAGLRVRLVPRVEDSELRRKALSLLGDPAAREAAYALLTGSFDDLAGLTAEARRFLLEKAAAPEGAGLRAPLAKSLALVAATSSEEEYLWTLVRGKDDAVSAWARGVIQRKK